MMLDAFLIGAAIALGLMAGYWLFVTLAVLLALVLAALLGDGKD